MEYVEISRNELQNYIEIFFQKLQQYHPIITEYFQLIYQNGLRINEPFNIQQWTDTSENTILLQPSKSSNMRSIEKATMSAAMLRILQGHLTYDFINSASLTHRFRANFAKIYCGEKKMLLGTHLFRYNFIKNKVYSGMSIEDVSTIVGHKKISSTTYYNEAKLYIKNRV